jgi:predicted amidophosphoribosyltransferase
MFLPSNCVSCGREPSVLCEQCRLELNESIRPISRAGLEGFFLIEYEQLGSQLMHAFKSGGLFALGQSLAARLAAEQPRPQVDWLVAAPSSAEATRTRGFVPAAVISATLGRVWGLPVLEARLVRDVADQAGLSSDQRRSNLAGAITVGRPLTGKTVWLVDDITTTGATLGELAAACRAAGASVAGFSTLAQTSLRHNPSPQLAVEGLNSP